MSNVQTFLSRMPFNQKSICFFRSENRLLRQFFMGLAIFRFGGMMA